MQEGKKSIASGPVHHEVIKVIRAKRNASECSRRRHLYKKYVRLYRRYAEGTDNSEGKYRVIASDRDWMDSDLVSSSLL